MKIPEELSLGIKPIFILKFYLTSFHVLNKNRIKKNVFRIYTIKYFPNYINNQNPLPKKTIPIWTKLFQINNVRDYFFY
jgi:hypothetical protein